MTKPKGFGFSETSTDFKYRQSQTTSVSGSTADLIDEEGKVVNQVVHGVTKEVTVTYFCEDKAAAEKLVTSLQAGGTVVTKADINENNNGFCTATVTKRILPDAATATEG
jgi:hypothetical protein